MPQRQCQALPCRAALGHRSLAVRRSGLTCPELFFYLAALRLATASVATAVLSMHLLQQDLMCRATAAVLMCPISGLKLHASVSLDMQLAVCAQLNVS